MSTRISLQVDTDDPKLFGMIEEIRAMPWPECDEMLAELMAWESRRILINVGEARGRRAAFAHNRRRPADPQED